MKQEVYIRADLFIVFKALIWVMCWHWGLVLGSPWLLARFCESEYLGWENPLYVQECRVQGNMSV